MSIRLKLTLSYFAIIFISILILVFSFAKMTTDFVNRVSESMLGDVPFHEAATDVLDIVVDFEHMIKYEPEKIYDDTFIKDIEASLMRYNINIYTAVDGKIVYYTSNEDLRALDDDLLHLEYRNGRKNKSFTTGHYTIGNTEYTVLRRYDETKNQRANIQFYMVFDSSRFNRLGEHVYRNIFKALFWVTIGILVMLAFIVTRMIVKPLKKLEDATNKIKNGQLDFELPRNKKDEIGRVLASFDIMREELKKSIDKQIQYEENRKELITSISHDLKTPITSIKGYVEGIKDGVADDQEKLDKYLDVIYKKSVDLDQLIDDLFLFSKLDLNRVPFHFEKVNAYNYFKDCADEMEMDLKKIGFKLDYQSTLKQDYQIMIDPQQLKRVILNTVQNAVKYTRDNNTINIRTCTKDQMIQIEIEDYGQGIKIEELDMIFDKFYRCDKSRNTRVGGSGLGLAIAKQIMEQHKGKIWAKSMYGEGTIIYLQLPISKG